MNNLKASQCTTRRDLPSAKRLLAAKALAPEPKERPSGIRPMAPDETPEAPPDETEALTSERSAQREDGEP
jgi:hypothetical protein